MTVWDSNRMTLVLTRVRLVYRAQAIAQQSLVYYDPYSSFVTKLFQDNNIIVLNKVEAQNYRNKSLALI